MERVRKMLGCDLPQTNTYTGEGVCVGVLDSGMASHPDIYDRIAAFKDFTNQRKLRGYVYDDNGHGTHVCGILAGNGRASKGRYTGIAPRAILVGGKVLDKKGGGSLKNLIQGLKWILELQEKYSIRILNISIEMDSDKNLKHEELQILKKYFEILWNKNVFIIVAAGNKGPNPMTISPLGECGSCVCVGCDDGDYIGKNGKSCSEYSGRGPGKEPDVSLSSEFAILSNPLKKPDIVAPGTDIISCNNKYNITPYISKSGTSMSAPIVSGACALCIQKYPDITNLELRRILLNSAKDLGKSWYIQGAGMLQINEMLKQKKYYKC